MNKQEQREIIQQKAAELSMEYPNLILEFATGVGKTRALLKCIAASKSEKKWLIIVPELALINNFKEDIKKHGYDYLLESRIEDVICYQSLHKYVGQSYNLGLDESHHVSDLRLEHLKDIDSDQRILLSATLSIEVKLRLSELGDWYNYTIDTEQAIDLGILPRPKINVVYINLDNHHKKFSYSIKDRFGARKLIKCTQLEYYKHLDKSVDYWKNRYEDKGEQWAHKRFMKAALDRKQFISETKTDKAIELIKDVKTSKRRMVVFCGSVDQAKQLGGIQSVHSRNTKDKNLQIIDEFNEGKTDELFANKMLREGMNLVSTEVGVIVQLDNQELGTIQMVGRVLRSDTPELYLTIAKGTKDEDYLDKALRAVKVDKQNVNYLN